MLTSMLVQDSIKSLSAGAMKPDAQKSSRSRANIEDRARLGFQDNCGPRAGMEPAEEFPLRSLSERIEFHLSRQRLRPRPGSLSGRRACNGAARHELSADSGEIFSGHPRGAA